MKISVITPSYQNSDWLKRCVLSAADQGAALQEHIVQDAGSTDGTRDWLSRDPRVRAFFEKDAGMYDAVNRGFAKARGEILAYLNCDEQYLPGALQKVVKFFRDHPDVDVCLADTVIVEASGRYLCHKLALIPGKMGIWVRFPVITAALFLRASALREKSLSFDICWKDYGDIFFVMALVRAGCRFGILPEFTSVFTDTGDNMNLKPNAQKERRIKESRTPKLVRVLRPLLLFWYVLRQIFRGAYWLRAFEYDIYIKEKSERVKFRAARPTTFWRGRSPWIKGKA